MILTEEILADPHRGFVLVDSVARTVEKELKYLDCLVTYVADESKDVAAVTDDETVKSDMKFVTHFKWISFEGEIAIVTAYLTLC